ncbi:MAG TPA: polysaccharide deacetylase family protein [Kofleriaceae bacterium]|nr:polysaccharide deacetylase family protein [Kofleriaceae bacterium]
MRHSLCLPALLLTACNAALTDLPVAIDPDAAPAAGSGDGSAGDTPYVSSVTVSLTFDDTDADQFQVGAMLKARDMRATFYVNSTRIGTTSYMTMQQVQSLARDGNEIAGHTLSHPHLTTLTLDDARREICNDRAALIADGFPVTSFAYPFGDSDTPVEQIASDCGYNSARDVGGFNAGTCMQCPVANASPPADPYDVRTPPSVVETTTLDMLQSYVLRAEAQGGGWVPLVLHHVCDGCNSLSISPALLEEYLDWLQAHGVAVRTVQEMIDGAVQAAITVP